MRSSRYLSRRGAKRQRRGSCCRGSCRRIAAEEIARGRQKTVPRRRPGIEGHEPQIHRSFSQLKSDLAGISTRFGPAPYPGISPAKMQSRKVQSLRLLEGWNLSVSVLESNEGLIAFNNVARRCGQLFHNLTQIFTRQWRYLRPLPFRFFDELWILQDLTESIA